MTYVFVNNTFSVKGIYFKYADEPVKEPVSKWSVVTLGVEFMISNL